MRPRASAVALLLAASSGAYQLPLPGLGAFTPARLPSLTMQGPSTSIEGPLPLGSKAAPALAHGMAALMAAVTLASGDVRVASAENELAVLASQKSTAELVNPSCFASSCKAQVEACAADADCVKGLACSAKCMGDAQCTVGCFARYNNPTLEKALQCTIEDAGCIQIATQTAGADSPFDAPPAPKALIPQSPRDMQGKWYKVLGFNPNYDCFECQRNSFAAGSDAKRLFASKRRFARHAKPRRASRLA